MISINTMIKRIAGLQGTRDITEWEDSFIGSVVDKTEGGKETTGLSGKQVEIVERIHNKHFA
jgi:hypothetical protein